jgi:hypothetical protein
VIADISDAKSVLQELQAIVPELPSVPVQPVIIASQEEPGMFDFYRHIPWFLPVHRYATPAQLLSERSTRVIEPSEAKLKFCSFVPTASAISCNLERERSGPRFPSDDGQIGTSLCRTDALHNIECRDRTAKTL